MAHVKTYSLMCTFGRWSWRPSACSRSAMIGVVVGVAVSLVLFPLVDERCLRSADNRFAGGRSLQSNLEKSRPDTAPVDDYEPHVQVDAAAGRTKSSQMQPAALPAKYQKPPARPRFFSTELSIKDKLFVAVLSTRETVEYLGRAMNETLDHHVQMQMIFVPAESAGTPSTSSHKSIVEIATTLSTDRRFPLEVIRYLGEHYAKDYDFFFVVKDVAYVRGMKLLEIVNHISISQPVYMGEALEETPKYCSLEGGILLSNVVVRATRDNVPSCIRHQSASLGAAEQLGQCVTSSAAVTCLQEVQGQHFKTFHLSRENPVTSSLQFYRNQNKFNTALTIHRLASAEEHYMLHLYFSFIELEATADAIVALQKGIAITDACLDENEKVIGSWPTGADPPYRGKDHFSIIRWDYLTGSVLYPDGDLDLQRNLTKDEMREIADVTSASVASIYHKDLNVTSFDKVVNVYRRFDPTRGMEYILDMIFRNRASATGVLKRIEAVRPLGTVELIPMPYVTENTRIVMVLPVTVIDQIDALRFLRDFSQVCLEKQDNSILVVVFLYEQVDRSADKGDIYSSVRDSVDSLNSKYHSEGAKLSWINVKMTNTRFSELAVLDLVTKKFSKETLFLVCRPEMEIRVDYLNRVRMNTVNGWQVFFPIPFAQYHRDIVFRAGETPSTIEIHKKHGHFSSHSFDHYSFYNADYIAGRKSVDHIVPIVRTSKDLQDDRHRATTTGFDVYSMFLSMKSVHTMRAVEPSLRIPFRMKLCEVEMTAAAHEQCLAMLSEGLAARPELSSLLLDYMKREMAVKSSIK